MSCGYLTERQLSGFENYKYSSVDTNPLSIYIMHPFWNKIVQACPLWVAPNLLTFVGFLFTVLACVLLTVYDYSFHAGTSDGLHPPIPSWVFMASSIFIFLAYTLDGIDGKQARRTGTSGPLGELFDHGLDSWTAVLIPTCLYSVFGRGAHSVTPARYYAVCWNVFLTFYLTHWEKYNTGVLFLPWGYDFSMISTTLVLAVTSFIGHDGWKVKVTDSVSTGHILELVFYLTSLAATLPVTLCNVRASYLDGSGKMRSASEALRPLVPVVSYLVVCAAWVQLSPGDVVSRHPRAFFLLTGTVFSNMTCRLVVSQMSGSRAEAFNWFLVPSFASFLLVVSLGSVLVETLVLHLLWLALTVAHVHYGASVVRQMCRHFNIDCFAIKRND